jgi:FtsP/CotA-like multicopper oxidase with cupredoxin domain
MKTQLNQINSVNRRVSVLLVLAIALVCTANVSAVTDIFLRADTTVMTMPDGRLVEMWGFAQDSAFESHDGVVTVPGPVLTIDPEETHLIIHLENNLPEPVSIIIPGQIAAMSPVSFPDEQGRNRIRSFTHEAPSGNTEAVIYEWTNLRGGTFLYQSGTHPALQIQMGLYGCLKKNFWNGTVIQAYDGVEFNNDFVLVFSEIDPALHDAVQADDYGPDKSMTSTIDYEPKYFLINGQAFTSIQSPVSIGQVGERILLRLVNAGIQSHVAVVDNLRGSVIAEDGYTYNYPNDLYAFDLPPAKTKDVLIEPQTEGIYTLYDHALQLTNDMTVGGGMRVKLEVAAVPQPVASPGTPADSQEVVAPLEESVQPVTVTKVVDQPSADLDNNGSVNYKDAFIFIRHWYNRTERSEENLADLNGDGVLDEKDVEIITQQLETAPKNPVLRRVDRRNSRLRR